jgi:hypothetical protein
MTRTIGGFLARAALPFAVLAYAGDSSAQAIVVTGPPYEYIASYEPIYYNGWAHYWWGDHWYYHDREAWHRWDREPLFLRNRRADWASHRHRWR